MSEDRLRKTLDATIGNFANSTEIGEPAVEVIVSQLLAETGYAGRV